MVHDIGNSPTAVVEVPVLLRKLQNTQTLAKEWMNKSVWGYLNDRVTLDLAESGLYRNAMNRKNRESAVGYATSLTGRNPKNPIYQQNLADANNLTPDRKG